MKSATGKPTNVDKMILGRVTKVPRSALRRKGFILVQRGNQSPSFGYSGVISTSLMDNVRLPSVSEISEHFYNDLHDGDVIMVQQDGSVLVVWDVESTQNSLLLSEACDCKCLMCPQPPKKHDPNQHILCNQLLDTLGVDEVSALCLTGGEPTLNKENFLQILSKIKSKFNQSNITVLTNAKGFTDFEYAKKCVIEGPRNILYCVSLHADNDRDHDRIVGASGSFQKTVKGITNLAKLRTPIEIRFVINKINVLRMKSFSSFVYRNFPFVSHVAFMGMEIMGLAEENMDDIWIDPYEYGEEITNVAFDLARKGIPVSIYNVPLCLLPEKGWKFSRQSISAWKNNYLPQCDNCSVKGKCCGIFTSSVRQSEQICPILP